MAIRTVVAALSLAAMLIAGLVTPALARPGCATHQSKTGNTISHCSANSDPYVPDVEGADARSREIAQTLYDIVQEFCGNAEISGNTLRSGQATFRPSVGKHWGANPRPKNVPFDPQFEWAKRPKTVLVEGGRLQGVMYVLGTARTFPNLGSIPRIHQHHGGGSEMFHIWCAPDLESSFRTQGPHVTGRSTSGRASGSASASSAPAGPAAGSSHHH